MRHYRWEVVRPALRRYDDAVFRQAAYHQCAACGAAGVTVVHALVGCIGITDLRNRVFQQDEGLEGSHGMGTIVRPLRPAACPHQWAARIEYVGRAVMRRMAAAMPSTILCSEDDTGGSPSLASIEAILRLEAARAEMVAQEVRADEDE